MKCWDTTVLTWQLHNLLVLKLADINKAYNIAFCLHSGAFTNKQKEIIYFTRQLIDIKIEKMAIIILDFAIQ